MRSVAWRMPVWRSTSVIDNRSVKEGKSFVALMDSTLMESCRMRRTALRQAGNKKPPALHAHGGFVMAGRRRAPPPSGLLRRRLQVDLFDVALDHALQAGQLGAVLDRDQGHALGRAAHLADLGH